MPLSEPKKVFWILRELHCWTFLSKPSWDKLGRPAKVRSPTVVKAGKETALSICKLLRVNLPEMDLRVGAEREVTLVAPSTTRSPSSVWMPFKVMMPTVWVAMAMLPVKVVQP